MKKQTILALLILNFAALNFNAARIVVTGNIQHTKATTLSYGYNNSIIRYNEVKKITAIDKKGNFKIELDLNSLTRINVVIDEQYTSFCVQPGDSLSIKIDYLNFDNSIVFGGQNSAKNNFEKEFNGKFIYGHEQDIYQQMARLKAVMLANYCDSSLKAQLNFTDAYKEKLDPQFIASFKKDLIYKSACDKLRYPFLWAYINKLQDTLPEMSYLYFDFMRDLSLNKDSLLTSEPGFDYLKEALSHYSNYVFHTSGRELNYTQKMRLAEALISSEKILLAYNSSLLMTALESENFTEAEKNFFAYEQKNPNSPYLKELRTTYEKIKSISPGQSAPAFSLLNDAGKKVSLNDFKGKVIYLDFWASWCGPCVRELASSKKIKPQFEGKDIVFLYISIDEDTKSWKEGIIKHEIKGVNLIAPSFNNTLCQDYNVKGIPSYFLIGRDGRIIDNNPPRPSSEEDLKKLLTSALEK